MGRECIDWFHPFHQTCNIDLNQDFSKGLFPSNGDIRWFSGGKLNVSYNLIDRHVEKGESFANKVALIHERNPLGQHVTVTYKELLQEVSRLANCLKRFGVRKGDTVGIYMSTCPYTVYALLACARIGAIHVVVFAGFSGDALSDRMNDARCKVLIANQTVIRGEKVIDLTKNLKEAMKKSDTVETLLVYDEENKVTLGNYGKTTLYSLIDEMKEERPYCPCEWMDSEDPLFILYTSGSTGKPKGMVHTQAGYLLGAYLTTKYIFDAQEGDVHGCMADIGWITGHTYIMYGPLAVGTTTVLFETMPTFPHHGRYWDTVQRHKLTQIYLSPTVIRSLMKYSDDIISQYDLSSLRVIGSVGEPINPASWNWYYEKIGKEKCTLVDTYWQTEGGSIYLSAIPGATGMKAGSCSKPFFGIAPAILDPITGQIIEGPKAKGFLAIAKPWPSISRTIRACHSRYINAYFEQFPGFYTTGDGGYRDKDEYYWIFGRVDDVINVSGHRLGTAEIESALVTHPGVSEAAVIGLPHEIKGTTIYAFCILKEGFQESEQLPGELAYQVRLNIGGLAVPEKIYIVNGLPKTISGKIMRRLLRKIVTGTIGESDDLSTLADPDVVEDIKKIVVHCK